MNKPQRYLCLITYLLNAGKAVTREDIFRHLSDAYGEYIKTTAAGDTDSGRRQFMRDLAELRESGVEIIQEPTAAGDEGYRLDKRSFFLPRVDFSPEELAVVRLSVAALLEQGTFPYAFPLAMALRKLAVDEDPDVVGYRVDAAGVVLSHPVVAQGRRLGPKLRTVARCVVKRKRLSFAYSARTTGEVTRREVEPYGLYCHRGQWVLVGFSVRREAMRLFYVHRMDDISANERAPGTPDFDVPDGFTVRRYMQVKPWQYTQHAPLKVAIEVRSEFARLVARQLGVQGDAATNGWTRFELEVTNGQGIVEWVLGQGPKARIAAPTEIRRALADAAKAILARYGKSTA